MSVPLTTRQNKALSKYAFASTGSAFPNAKSSQDGVTEEGKTLQGALCLCS
jgi:hypothetical protein